MNFGQLSFIVAIALLGFLGYIATALISIRFSKGQLRRFPVLRKFHGKQIYYLLIVTAAGLSGSIFFIWQYYVNQPDIELTRSPYGNLASKASYALFNRDVDKGTASNEARDYFRAAERSMGSTHYKEAAEEYQLSIKSSSSVAALLNLGVDYQYLGDFNHAEETLLEGLQKCRKLGYSDIEPAFLANLGIVYAIKGDTPQALVKSEQAQQMAKDRSIVQGTVLTNLGNIYALQGKFAESLKAYSSALSIYQSSKEIDGQAQVIDDIGSLYDDQSKHKEGMDYHERALNLFREAGDVRGQAKVKSNIGNSYADTGDTQNARKSYQDGLALAKQSGDLLLEAQIVGNLGELDRETSSPDAESHIQHSLELYKTAGSADGQAVATLALGNLHAYSLQAKLPFDRAFAASTLKLFKESHDLYSRVGDLLGQARALGNMAEIERLQHDFSNAISHAKEALDIFKRTENTQGEGNSLTVLGNLYAEQKIYSEAIPYYDDAAEMEHRVGDRQREGIALANLGEMYLDLHEYAKSISKTDQALDVVKTDYPVISAYAEFNLGQAYEAQKETWKALVHFKAALKIYEEQDPKGQQVKIIGSKIEKLSRRH